MCHTLEITTIKLHIKLKNKSTCDDTSSTRKYKWGKDVNDR